VLRDEHGAPVHLAWGRDVLPGDLLAIDYVGSGEALPRAWDHIGALAGDSYDRPDGTLGADDPLWHMAPRGLIETRLADEAPIRARVWRFRDRRAAALTMRAPLG
jgi:hypothetical protein